MLTDKRKFCVAQYLYQGHCVSRPCAWQHWSYVYWRYRFHMCGT